MSKLKLLVWMHIGPERHNSSNTFVSTNVRQLDVGDGKAIRAGCRSGFGVQIYQVVVLAVDGEGRNCLRPPLWHTPVYRTFTRISLSPGEVTG